MVAALHLDGEAKRDAGRDRHRCRLGVRIGALVRGFETFARRSDPAEIAEMAPADRDIALLDRARGVIARHVDTPDDGFCHRLPLNVTGAG